jgi:hypothetical protein
MASGSVQSRPLHVPPNEILPFRQLHLVPGTAESQVDEVLVRAGKAHVDGNEFERAQIESNNAV